MTMPLLVFDPYAYDMHEDPYPTYARLRAERPVYRNDDMGFWALSRHADIVSAFRDTTRFSSAPPRSPWTSFCRRCSSVRSA